MGRGRAKSVLALWLLVHSGGWLGLGGAAVAGLEIAPGQVLVVGPAPVGIDLRLGKELLGILRFALGEHLEAVLREQVILHLRLGRRGIHLQRVLAFLCAARVVAVEQPLTGLNRQALLMGAGPAVQV